MIKKIIFALFIALIPNIIVIADDIKYEDAINAVKEVMKDYYIRGSYIQYNSGKEKRGSLPPEEATIQDTQYSVCSTYTYNIYNEAFGMYKINNSKKLEESFPDTAGLVINNKKYKYDKNFIIYYEDTTSDNNYFVDGVNRNEKIDFNSFINLIRPGDIFAYTGHVMIAYDVVDRDEDGIVDDVLMLNSSQSPFILTKLKSTNRLSYNIFKSSRGDNNFLDIPEQGTIMYFWLSNNQNFVVDNMMSCQLSECIVMRPFYRDDNGNAKFYYNYDIEQYYKSKLRTDYPGLMIEKTVDKGDNNSVYLGDTLIYDIKITNKSNVTYDGQEYASFIIEEELDDKVKYISSDNNATINDSSIRWEIPRLGVGESITLKYTVEVNKIGVTPIQSIGKFYKNDNSNGVYITTGKVSNPLIVRKYLVYNKFSTCYKQSNETGLNMINDVYSCVTNNKLLVDFTTFDINQLILKNNESGTYSHKDAIYLNKNSNQFYTMILNNYWNALTLRDDDNGDSYYYLPRWSGGKENARARTINPSDFRDGDVLIYTVNDSTGNHISENGLYVYIYIDGKFVGNNYTGDSTERNVFSYSSYTHRANLYGEYKKIDELDDSENVFEYVNYQTLLSKDYYVILRPLIGNVEFNVIDYKIDYDNQILYGIDCSVTIDELESKIDTTGDIKGIFDSQNSQVNDNIKTGDKIRTKFGYKRDKETNINEDVLLEYTLSIKGDVLGTGKLNISDAEKIAEHIIDGNAISGNEYLLAADYNNDNEIKINDVIMVIKEVY